MQLLLKDMPQVGAQVLRMQLHLSVQRHLHDVVSYLMNGHKKTSMYLIMGVTNKVRGRLFITCLVEKIIIK